MKVILAPTIRECELLALENGIPPKGPHTLLVPTNSPSSLNKLRGLMLEDTDVIRGGRVGKHHQEAERMLQFCYIRPPR